MTNYISDYIHLKFGGGRLGSYGETFTQIGVRQVVFR